MDKSDKWFDRPMPMKLFTVFCAGILILWTVCRCFSSVVDSDMLWTVSLGKEILKNGIPRTNIWTIDKQPGFVAQQWLYAVVLAFAEQFGTIGLALMLLLQVALLFILTMLFFKIKNVSAVKSFFCTAIVMIFCQIYVFCIRPELITILFLLVECIALEKFIVSGKCRWLIFLPVMMLFEINFHASMWIFHYAVLAAYLVPAFYLKSSVKNDLYKHWRVVALFTVLMTGVMFINPYGIDAILYVFKSFAAKTFSYVQISEMTAPDIISEVTVTLTAAVGVLILCLKFKYIESTTFNVFLGFFAMSTLALRNIMFMSIVFVFLLRDFWQAIDGKINIDWKKDIKNNLYLIFAVGFVIIGLDFSTRFCPYEEVLEDSTMYELYDYIASSGKEDPKIFTGFDSGGYFEYAGFKNIYMDARPELYTSAFTGDKNILADYALNCIGYSGFTNVQLTKKADHTCTKDWLDYYDFDYLVVSKVSEPRLAGYMEACSNYRQVETESVRYILYEKAVDVDG